MSRLTAAHLLVVCLGMLAGHSHGKDNEASKPAKGATYYVAPQGNDGRNSGTDIHSPLRTIGRAISVAGPGDTIEVRAGTYNEALVIRSAGTPSAWIRLRGTPGEWPVIRRSGRGPTVYFYHAACDENTVGNRSGNADCFASYWALQGLVIQGSQGGGDDGNAVKIDTARVRLQGNKLCCSEADIVKLVRTANDVEILSNEIWQDPAVTAPSGNAQGIDIVGADRTRVAGNLVHDVPDVGMYAKGNARNTVFEGNRLVNIGSARNGHAIMLGQETDEDRMVDGPYESYDGIVRNNVVVNATWACVATSSSNNVRIYNNSCYNTGTLTHGSIFLSNEAENPMPGVNIEIMNNIVYGSARRPLIKIGAKALADYSTLRISDNIYFAIGGAPSFQADSESGPASFDQWRKQYKALSGHTDNSRVIDPQFANGKDGNLLALKPGSPAINAGKTTPWVATDIVGTARPQGSSTDIGAYEY